MAQPTSQPELFAGTPHPSPLATPTPAGSGDNATSAGGNFAAGKVSPAPAIVSSVAAPDYPPPAKRESASPAKSVPALLQVLPSGALTYKVQGSRFETIAAQTLDNAGTTDDGFDELINPALTAFGEDQPALGSIGAGLADADFTPGEFTATVHAPITADIADLLAAGDTALSGVADAFGSAPVPPPGSGSGSGDNGTPGGAGGNDKDLNQGNFGGFLWQDWGDPLDYIGV